MNVHEIKQAVDQGLTVHWSNKAYQVVKDNNQYLIKCDNNHQCIGLTWLDNITLNGKESEFYIGDL